ncbi:MAG: CGNR zinc finger domain-containing protein [Candidatus Bipolaricaulaceae bacterium]
MSNPRPQRTAATVKLVGGELCLDFANTADWHDTDEPEELLVSYRVLVQWAERAGAVTAGEGARLIAEGSRCPREAHRALEQAIALREVMFRMFSAAAAARAVRHADLVALNAALGRWAGRRRVTASGSEFVWSWAGEPPDLTRPLWPVVISAAELLTSPRLGRVKKCQDGRCGWLFLDASRNRSRRWCAMSDCGNRAKARRHRARTWAS